MTKYSSEIMSEISNSVNDNYSKLLNGKLKVPENIQAFFSSVIQDCKNIAFDNNCQVRVLAVLDDTLIVEVLVFKTSSIFLHCYVRQSSIYVTMYSTFDDRQIELIKVTQGFYESPENKVAELLHLRKKYDELSTKYDALEKRLAAYNGSGLLETLKGIVSQVETFEQDKEDTSCQ